MTSIVMDKAMCVIRTLMEMRCLMLRIFVLNLRVLIAVTVMEMG